MRIIAGVGLVFLCVGWASALPVQGASDNEKSVGDQISTPMVLAPGPVGVSPPTHPMAAYFALRPVLPAKPAFFPPVVDPNAYIDRKAWILSNLFGAPMPSTTNVGAAGAPVPALTNPFYPGYFISKKNSFLNAMYAGQQPVAAAVTGQARRALSPVAGSPFAPSAFAPSAFAAKKAAFLQKLFETLNTTAPPPTTPSQPSWMDLLDDSPDGNSQVEDPNLSRVPLQVASPVDPSFYANKKSQFLNQLFDNLGLPPPPPAMTRPTIMPPGFWSPFAGTSGAAVPLVKPTIVPPGYWVPPGVSSSGTIYKQKVADFLGKLFQQLNSTASIAENNTSKGPVKRTCMKMHENAEAAGGEETQHEASVSRRSIDGPFGGSFGAFKPLAGSPFEFGKSFPGAVDPQFFIDKKNAFLSKLMASKMGSASGDASDATSASNFWGPYGGFYPTPKPTIVPPDFWNPFPSGGANPVANPTTVPTSSLAVKPTIVPPNFWSPFSTSNDARANAIPAPAEALIDKKAKFLDTLFGVQDEAPAQQPKQPQQLQQPQQISQPLPDPAQTQGSVSEEDSLWDIFLKELAEALAAPTHTTYLSRRGMSSDVAQQQLQDSAVAQLTAIKDDMLTTVNAILKQKEESAAAAPAFPFGKSMYAAYGAMKKGGAGGPGGAAAGKKGPGKGGYPFWGGAAAAPTPDPTLALQQRLQVLSQSFDSLATLQRDASAALQAASNPSLPAAYSYPYVSTGPAAPAAPIMDSTTLLQLIRAAAAKDASPAEMKAARKGKSGKTAPRSVQFAVRQGQLSLPAGAEELLTAGGGATPDQHEGGGLRLQIKVPAVAQA